MKYLITMILLIFNIVTYSQTEHLVKPKETFYGLSKLYNVSIEDIKINNPKTSNGLKIGQKLKIPNSVIKDTISIVKVPRIETDTISIVEIETPRIETDTITKKLEYPRIETDESGEVVMVLTMKQAMKLDNDSDLLKLFEQLDVEIGNYDTMCIKVVNDKDKVISSQKLEIAKLNEMIKKKSAEVNALQESVASYIKANALSNEQLENRQKTIGEKNTQIKKLKGKMVIGGVGGGLAIIGLLFLLLK